MGYGFMGGYGVGLEILILMDVGERRVRRG
jgi:hypothetical protein